MIRAKHALLMAALLSSPALAQMTTSPNTAAPAPGEGAPVTDQNRSAVQSGQAWSPSGSPTDPRAPTGTPATGGTTVAPTDQATTGSAGGQMGTSDNGMNSTGTIGQSTTGSSTMGSGSMGSSATDSSMGSSTGSSTGSSGSMSSGSMSSGATGSGTTSGSMGSSSSSSTGTSSGGMAQMAAADPQDYPRCSARRRDRCQQTAAQEARATATPRRRR